MVWHWGTSELCTYAVALKFEDGYATRMVKDDTVQKGTIHPLFITGGRSNFDIAISFYTITPYYLFF